MTESEDLISNRRKCFRAYTLLVSGIFNFATSKNLFEKRSYSWGISSSYYTHVQIGRMVIYIIKGNYPHYHSELPNLLKTARNTNSIVRNYLVQNLPEISKEKVGELGDQLKVLSDIRNSNSYDSFIIANQINHALLESYFQNLCYELNRITKEWIIFAIEFFRNFILLHSEKEEFIGLLYNLTTKRRYQWGFPTVFDELRTQSINESIVGDIERIVKSEFENKIPSDINPRPPNNKFFETLTYDKYKEKGDVMEQFKAYIAKYLSIINSENN